MKSKLDELSAFEIALAIAEFREAIKKQERWMTVKTLANIQRIEIALSEWLEEFYKK